MYYKAQPIVDPGLYLVVLDKCTVHGVRGNKSVAIATQIFKLFKEWHEIFWQLWAICSLVQSKFPTLTHQHQ